MSGDLINDDDDQIQMAQSEQIANCYDDHPNK